MNDNLPKLLDFWFANDQLWFGATPEDDKLIGDEFGGLLQIYTDTSRFLPASLANLEKVNLKNLMALIILWDQISRHVHRTEKEKIVPYHEKALVITNYILDNNLDKSYEPKERCFILLPLRHTFSLIALERVINKIKEYKDEKDDPIYNRFFRSTLYSYSDIMTRMVEPESSDHNITDKQISNILSRYNPFRDYYRMYTKDSFTVSLFGSIWLIVVWIWLSIYSCIVAINPFGKHDYKISVINLLKITVPDKNESIYKAFDNCIRKLDNKIEGITVSLSGGVDSMVALFVLYHLSQQCKKFKIIAVTIDYGNRDTSQIEMEFVKRWCKLLGIPHYIRHVWELRRNRTGDRDFYEKVTRRFRFDMYRRFGFPVILGHNLDDAIENVFSNIKKTRSFNNLLGMTNISTEEQVTIVRPMLMVPKKDIYLFANKYLIPHLEDSTPKWSERGQMRDNLIPFLDQFDPRIIPGLIELNNNIQQMYTIYENSTLNSFWRNHVVIAEKSIKLEENAPEKQFGFVFWKDIMKRFSEESKLPVPTNRSIGTFIGRLSHNQYGKIIMGHGFVMTYGANGLFI